jgi:hypothetical protein
MLALVYHIVKKNTFLPLLLALFSFVPLVYITGPMQRKTKKEGDVDTNSLPARGISTQKRSTIAAKG